MRLLFFFCKSALDYDRALALLLGVRGLYNPAAGRRVAHTVPPASAGGVPSETLPFSDDFMLLSCKELKARENMHVQEIKIVEKFKQLVSQRVKVLEVRVFGSRARGDATEESDLDVLVVVDKLDHAIEKYISECAWEAGFPEDIVVMPIAITQETLKNSPLRESVFIRTVYQEGVGV